MRLPVRCHLLKPPPALEPREKQFRSRPGAGEGLQLGELVQGLAGQPRGRGRGRQRGGGGLLVSRAEDPEVHALVVVPRSVGAGAEGHAELHALPGVRVLREGDVEGEAVAVGLPVGLVHVGAGQVPVAAPGVEGDADADLLVEAHVLDPDGAAEGALVDGAVLQAHQVALELVAEGQVVGGGLREPQTEPASLALLEPGALCPAPPPPPRLPDLLLQTQVQAAALALGEEAHGRQGQPLGVSEDHALLLGAGAVAPDAAVGLHPLPGLLAAGLGDEARPQGLERGDPRRTQLLVGAQEAAEGRRRAQAEAHGQLSLRHRRGDRGATKHNPEDRLRNSVGALKTHQPV